MCAVTHDALGNSVPCAVLRPRYVTAVVLYIQYILPSKDQCCMYISFPHSTLNHTVGEMKKS